MSRNLIPWGREIIHTWHGQRSPPTPFLQKIKSITLLFDDYNSCVFWLFIKCVLVRFLNKIPLFCSNMIYPIHPTKSKYPRHLVVLNECFQCVPLLLSNQKISITDPPEEKYSFSFRSPKDISILWQFSQTISSCDVYIWDI